MGIASRVRLLRCGSVKVVEPEKDLVEDGVLSLLNILPNILPNI